MSLAPVGTETLRRQNTARVLRSLREEGPAGRARLAERTGLSRATVGAIVADLTERTIATEGSSRIQGRGRPVRPVALRPGAVLGLGMEVNVDYVAAAAVDLAGEVVAARTRPSEVDGAVDGVGRLAEELVRELGADRFVGACLAVPGLIDRDHRTVAWAPNLRWEGVRPAESLAPLLDQDIVVENDANLAALAEARHGAALDHQHALYLTGTIGLGGGILESGRLVRGGGGFAGEIGHLPFGDRDAVCGCGRLGCWEASVGLEAMLELTGEPAHDDPVAAAASVAARADDPAVVAALAELGRRIGLGIASLSSILDPDVVVLGGYFAPLSPWLLPAADAAVLERLPTARRRRPALRAGALGIDAAALGAAEHALGTVLSGTAALPDASVLR